MEETRGITVKVAESLHSKAKQEAEAKEQTMSQFIEAVLGFYFIKGEEKEMSGNKRTLAFQVSEDFFAEVQDYIKANGMKLKDFGTTAMRRMMESTATEATDTSTPTETTTPTESAEPTEPTEQE